MWEKEQGRKMTPDERATINRGCIGITAANLHGGGNPLDSAVKTYATFELAPKYMVDHNKLLDEAAKQPGSTVGPARYVVFAQLFWSNQSDNYDDRLHPDDKAFRPDRETGEIDMSSYKYHAQSRIKKDAVTGPKSGRAMSTSTTASGTKPATRSGMPITCSTKTRHALPPIR